MSLPPQVTRRVPPAVLRPLALLPVAAALTAGLQGCGADDAPREPVARASGAGVAVAPPEMPVTIEAPAAGARVDARLVDGRLEATVAIRGFAREGSAVRVSTRCGSRRCARRVTAGAGGAWSTRLPLLAPTEARRWRISARYATGATRATSDHVRVRLASRELRALREQGDRGAGRSPATTAESPTSAVSGSGGEVLVVGDSLEVLTSPYLQRHLPGVKLTINAEGGYSSLQIFELFRESFAPSQSVIVFDAGTNDNPSYPQILAGRLQAVARLAGDRCLVVPTIHGLTVDGVTSRGKNRVVRAFAAARPGTQVPDWARAVREHPELMQPDDLHPTAAGADYRAQLIAAGVRGCMLG